MELKFAMKNGKIIHRRMSINTMTEQIYKDIYRIIVPLKGNPLKYLNSYFIKSGGDQLVIDLGFRTEDCFRALTEGLNELGCDREKLKVAITHLHSDHSGNVNELTERFNNPVYMGRLDVENSVGSDDRPGKNQRLLKEGFLPLWIEQQKIGNPSVMAWIRDPYKVNWVPMDTGDKIKVGEYELSWITTPGHTPGNAMLYEANHKIMFTGDNVLFDITPNITAWPGMPDALGSYLESLALAKKYDVKYAFPGHREFKGDDYYLRIDRLIQHHEKRLAEALSIIKRNPGSNAVEICSQMTWKIRCNGWDDFPVTQRFFAVGETLSHLDYLLARGEIIREEDPNGIRVYY